MATQEDEDIRKSPGDMYKITGLFPSSVVGPTLGLTSTVRAVFFFPAAWTPFALSCLYCVFLLAVFFTHNDLPHLPLLAKRIISKKSFLLRHHLSPNNPSAQTLFCVVDLFLHLTLVHPQLVQGCGPYLLNQPLRIPNTSAGWTSFNHLCPTLAFEEACADKKGIKFTEWKLN